MGGFVDRVAGERPVLESRDERDGEGSTLKCSLGGSAVESGGVVDCREGVEGTDQAGANARYC